MGDPPEEDVVMAGEDADGPSGQADDDFHEAEDGGHPQEEDEEGMEPQQPSAEELKAQWVREKKLLDWVKAQGFEEHHPSRRHAEQQVELAYQAWQGAKPKQAFSRLMQRAEAALERARRQVSKMEQSISELDDWYEHERLQRCQLLHQHRARAKEREEQLAEVTRGAAEDYGGDEAMGTVGEEVLHETVRTIEHQLGPALEKIRESLAHDADLQQQVEGTLQTVTCMYGSVLQAARRSGAAHYDMATSDEEGGGDYGWRYDYDDDWHDHHEQWGQWWDYSSSHTADQRWGGADAGECDARWRQQPAQRAADDNPAMDTAEVRAPKWMRSNEARDDDHGERTWKKYRWSSGDGGGGGGCAAGASSSGVPSSGRTGAAAAAGEGTNAGDAVQTTGGTAATDGSAAASAAADALQCRREQILQQATKDGVPVDAAHLASLGAEDLESWSKANLL